MINLIGWATVLLIIGWTIVTAVNSTEHEKEHEDDGFMSTQEKLIS